MKKFQEWLFSAQREFTEVDVKSSQITSIDSFWGDLQDDENPLSQSRTEWPLKIPNKYLKAICVIFSQVVPAGQLPTLDGNMQDAEIQEKEQTTHEEQRLVARDLITA